MPIVLSGSTGISGVAGTSGSPAYVGVDTNTGIFFPSEDVVAVSVGGTEVMRLNSSGGNLNVTTINNGPLSGARNRIINGDMRIDQRNAGVSTVITNLVTYNIDRWTAAELTDGAATVQRSGVAPVGFTSSLLWTTTTADASLAAGQISVISQFIEGYNISDLNFGTADAQPITLSFWVRTSSVGVHGGAVRNNGFTRSYPFTYTINSANTWEYKTITIPGDTTGTWLTDNRTGMEIMFSMGDGTTFQGTAGSWASADYHTATGITTNVIGTLNGTWYITGVQLEAGTVATPFERRSYGQELALCQRYYEKSFNINTAPADAATGDHRIAIGCVFNTNVLQTQYITFSVRKRVAPTVMTFYRPSFLGTAGQWGIYESGTSWAAKTMVDPSANELGFTVGTTLGTSSNAQAVLCSGHWSASSEL